MTSYFSSITSSSAISNLGTRLSSLRRAITLGDEADDPDNEDCSHISNVLRAYYTEKGRPYPAWLPPDPKNPNPPQPTRVVATSQIQPGAPGQAPVASSYGRGGGLGDLWGDTGSPQPAASQTASLRRGRSTPNASGAPLAAAATAPAAAGAGPMSSSPSPVPSPGLGYPAGGRPLPSQRAGSYQTMPGSQGSGATSAQERLRARLQGGRSPSPGQIDPSMRKPVGGMTPRWGSR